MKKIILLLAVVFVILPVMMPGTVPPDNETPKTTVRSVLVICPFPDVEKRQLLETAFVKALIQSTGLETKYPCIGTLTSGEELTREEFIKRINDKKIETLLFFRIKGIATNLNKMGGSPDPFSPTSTGQDTYGGVYVPKGRAAKTWYQVSLVDFKSGKPLWEKVTRVLGDIWLSLNRVSKSMAKKTAKELNKTGLLAPK